MLNNKRIINRMNIKILYTIYYIFTMNVFFKRQKNFAVNIMSLINSFIILTN